MHIAARCISSAIVMPLKMIFKGCQLKKKTPPFLYNIKLTGFT
jgi:hypothetical protein